MKIIDLYIKFTSKKIAFIKKYKKLVCSVFLACLFLFIITSASLIFFNNYIQQVAKDSDSMVDQATGQEQMDYKEIVSDVGDEYSVSVGIPKLKQKDEASLRASEEMKNYFLEQMESYKTNFKSSKIKEAPSSILREQNFYSGETFVFVGKRFVTFSTEEITGTQFQAFPQKHMTYFTYDKELKKLVTLSDIFVTNDVFYKKVSDLVYESILPELDTIMFYNSGKHVNEKDKERIKFALSRKKDSFDLSAIFDNEVLFSFNPFTFSDGAPFSETISIRVSFTKLKEFKK